MCSGVRGVIKLSYTLNPKPQTLNPKPRTANSQEMCSGVGGVIEFPGGTHRGPDRTPSPERRFGTPQSRICLAVPESIENLSAEERIRNPRYDEPETLNPKPETLNPKP